MNRGDLNGAGLFPFMATNAMVSGSTATDGSAKSRLEVRNLSVRFGALQAVSDLSLDVAPSTVTALIGPNGAGKTTAFNAITGFIRPTSGRVLLDGEDLVGLRPHQVAARGVARTFQKASVFPRLSAFENVRIGCHRRSTSNTLARMLGLPGALRRERDVEHRAHELLEFVSVPGQGRLAGSLPHGEQRLLAVAVALGGDPRFLLLDEPTAGLNSTESMRMRRLLEQLCASGIGVLLVEHDMRFVMGVSHHVVVLNAGTKIFEGSPAQVQENPEVRAAYLGRREI